VVLSWANMGCARIPPVPSIPPDESGSKPEGAPRFIPGDMGGVGDGGGSTGGDRIAWACSMWARNGTVEAMNAALSDRGCACRRNTSAW
jgi:hypothetical protein